MYIKKDQPYICTICVQDKAGAKISNDTPYIIIFDTQAKKYYNGLFFEDTETKLQMRYSQNGTYIYEFVPETISSFEVKCVSEKYETSNILMLDVYDLESTPSYEWKTGNTFVISQPNVTGGDFTCSIQRSIDNYYWSGAEWKNTKTELSMYRSQNNALWILEFTPYDVDQYTITVTSKEESYVYVLDVTNTLKEQGAPVMVNSSSLRFSDGTDSVVITKRGEPIAGASVSAYDKNTKKLIRKTITTRDGKWNMMIPHGDYIFMFSKDGFSTISLERSV